MYDYLIVGAGLFGAVFAQQAKEIGKKVSIPGGFTPLFRRLETIVPI